MIKTIHGKVRGKTIELNEDLGVPDGQEIEIQVKISSPRSICSTPSRRYVSPASATLRSEKLMPAARPIVATTTRSWPAFASGSITPARAA